jgi:hypothetical protein
VPTFHPSDHTPLAKGPGTLFWAPPATALPDYTVAGSVFSVNAWTGWFKFGPTMSGHEFGYDLKTTPINVAEFLDDIDQVTEGRTVHMKFEVALVTATNFVRALNRPVPTTTGSGTTLRTTVKAPALGGEQYCMIGWQSTDDTERIVAQVALQIGSLSVKRDKGAKIATYMLWSTSSSRTRTATRSSPTSPVPHVADRRRTRARRSPPHMRCRPRRRRTRRRRPQGRVHGRDVPDGREDRHDAADAPRRRRQEGRRRADMDGLVAMYEVLRDCIEESEWAKFETHAVDTKADADDLQKVVADVIEVVSARPTQSPNG